MQTGDFSLSGNIGIANISLNSTGNFCLYAGPSIPVIKDYASVSGGGCYNVLTTDVTGGIKANLFNMNYSASVVLFNGSQTVNSISNAIQSNANTMVNGINSLQGAGYP